MLYLHIATTEEHGEQERGGGSTFADIALATYYTGKTIYCQ